MFINVSISSIISLSNLRIPILDTKKEALDGSKVLPGTRITDGSSSDNASDNLELRLDESLLTGE